jgi:uncharacterized protein YecT (DUF1311 family)
LTAVIGNRAAKPNAPRGRLRLLGPSVVALSVAAALSAAAAERTLPSAGAWDVVRVEVDRNDQPHWLYVPDDPRWIGRELTIGASALSLNDGSPPCNGPRWTASKATLGRLIASSFPRPPGLGLSAKPAPADFRMDDSASKSVTVGTVRCRGGEPAQPWNAVWFVLASPDRLMMPVETSALLLLTRRMPNAQPQASFPCGSAKSAAEATLCGSVALAAFDRSIAAAFQRALEHRSQGQAQLRTEQTEWLKRRDACERDEACLAQTMRERIDELMQD